MKNSDIDTTTHSGYRAPDATRQKQYDELAAATSLEAIQKTEIGQEAAQSPAWDRYVKKMASLAEKPLTTA